MQCVVQQVCDRGGDLRHGGDIGVTERLAPDSDHREDRRHVSVEEDGHDQTWAIAEEFQCLAVGRAGETVVEVCDDLLGQVPQSQRLPTGSTTTPGDGPEKGCE